jgi:4-hydroxy-3-methylbut-2-enyl diphosphate reductase
MVIVGGKHSSNTRKLWEICKNNCEFSIIIESPSDVSVENLPLNGIIGVVAGASTPQWLIREVITSMNEQDLNNPAVEAELDATTPEAVQAQSVPEEPPKEAIDAPVQEGSKEEQAEQAAPAEQEQEAPAQKEEAPARELSPEESFERDLEKSLVRIRPGQVKKGTVCKSSATMYLSYRLQSGRRDSPK